MQNGNIQKRMNICFLLPEEMVIIHLHQMNTTIIKKKESFKKFVEMRGKIKRKNEPKKIK